MRPQILPVILCIFITVLAKGSATFPIDNTAVNSYKTIDTKAFTGITKDLKNIISTSVYKYSNIKKSISKNGLNYYNLDITDFDEINALEDFSYNFIVSQSGGIDNSSANIFPVTHLTNSFSQGLYFGFALTIIFLNFVCFLLFDEKVFALYGLALASITSVFFYNDGLIDLLTTDILSKNVFIQSTLLLIAIGFSGLFASKYLCINSSYPKLKNITISLFGISAVLLVLGWGSKNTLFINLSHSLSFLILVVYFMAGVLLFSKKNYIKFYVIAYFIPLMFTIDYYVLRGFGIDFLFTEAVHLKVAATVEMLLLTYAIMYRMRAIKDENELRQTEMRIFLKRQDSNNRHSVEQLVEDVYLENLIMHYDLDGLEIKLLQYISEGKTNEKILRKLKITESELEEHTKELYEKLEIGEHIQEDIRLVDNQPDYIYN